MTKGNRRDIEEAKDVTEPQGQAMRDFIENKTGTPHPAGPVDDDTSRMPDTQNRLITEHNQRM